MAVLTVRNIDDDLKRNLRVAAAQRGVSMEEHVRQVLRASTSQVATGVHWNLDRGAARAYARLSAAGMAAGRPVSMADALIASICLRHGATLATRNLRDFEGCGIALVNPWG